MKRLLIPAMLVVLSIAVYLPTLKYDFVIDDARQIEMMSSRFTWDQIPSYFTTDVWRYIEGRTSNYYRPFFLLWMMLTEQAVGLEHPLWHLSAILTNALAVLMFYFLALKLTGSVTIGGIAAAIFAVHPVHIESVAWVSGVTEPLWAIFFFATLVLFIDARQEPDPSRARWFRIAAEVAFFVAIFAKETAIVTPVLIFAYAFWFPSSNLETSASKPRIKAALLATLPYVQIAAVYLAARLYALKGFSPVIDPWPLKTFLATVPTVAGFYAKELLWPFQLTVFPPVYPVHQLEWSNFFAPVILAALVIAALLWAARKNRTAAFCALLLAATIAPVVYVRVFSKQDFVHDRYLYVPSAGFCLLLAMGIVKLVGWWRPPVLAAALAPLIAVLAFFTIRESEPWHDQLTLAEFAMAMAPGHPSAELQLLTAYIHQERYSEALPLAIHQIEVQPRNAGLHIAAGICHLKLAHWALAAAQFKIAITAMPTSAQSFLCLGMSELELGDIEDAEAHMRRAIDLRTPGSAQYRGYRYYLGDLLERKGDSIGALDEYGRELIEYPDDGMAAQRSAELKLKLGR